MKNMIAMVTIVVRDYDEAINFYTQKMGFVLLEDTPMEHGKRWVRVSPGDQHQSHLLLAKAKNVQETMAIGNQTGGRVGFFLHTDDFTTLYENWTKQGVRLVRPPSEESFGTVAVFEDLYGNLWDVIQPTHPANH